MDGTPRLDASQPRPGPTRPGGPVDEPGRHVAARPDLPARSASPSADAAERVRSASLPSPFTELPLELSFTIVEHLDATDRHAVHCLAQTSRHFAHVVASNSRLSYDPRKVRLAERSVKTISDAELHGDQFLAIAGDLAPLFGMLSPASRRRLIDAATQHGDTERRLRAARHLLTAEQAMTPTQRAELLAVATGALEGVSHDLAALTLTRYVDRVAPGERPHVQAEALKCRHLGRLHRCMQNLADAATASSDGEAFAGLLKGAGSISSPRRRAKALQGLCKPDVRPPASQCVALADAVLALDAEADADGGALEALCKTPWLADVTEAGQNLATRVARHVLQLPADSTRRHMALRGLAGHLSRIDSRPVGDGEAGPREDVLAACLDVAGWIGTGILSALADRIDVLEPGEQEQVMDRIAILERPAQLTKAILLRLHGMDGTRQAQAVDLALQLDPGEDGDLQAALEEVHDQAALPMPIRRRLIDETLAETDPERRRTMLPGLVGSIRHGAPADEQRIVKAILDPWRRGPLDLFSPDALRRLAGRLDGLAEPALRTQVIDAALDAHATHHTADALIPLLDTLQAAERRRVVATVLRVGVDLIDRQGLDSLGDQLAAIDEDQREQLAGDIATQVEKLLEVREAGMSTRAGTALFQRVGRLLGSVVGSMSVLLEPSSNRLFAVIEAIDDTATRASLLVKVG